MSDSIERCASGRAEVRTNLFVLAALRSNLAGGPVRIRNLSKRGMLVEGAVIPPTGTQVRIERGSLVTSGIVVWSECGRAGVALASSVDVKSWLPRRGNSGQSRVDEIVQTLKSGLDFPSRSTGTFADGPELDSLIRELGSVSQALAEDPQVVSTHAELLQRLDIVGQQLGLLARTPSNTDLKSTA